VNRKVSGTKVVLPTYVFKALHGLCHDNEEIQFVTTSFPELGCLDLRPCLLLMHILFFQQ